MATIQQLKEELQKERSIVLVLQRQKEGKYQYNANL